jgi:hypothetical protein
MMAKLALRTGALRTGLESQDRAPTKTFLAAASASLTTRATSKLERRVTAVLKTATKQLRLGRAAMGRARLHWGKIVATVPRTAEERKMTDTVTVVAKKVLMAVTRISAITGMANGIAAKWSRTRAILNLE